MFKKYELSDVEGYINKLSNKGLCLTGKVLKEDILQGTSNLIVTSFNPGKYL